jgi:hypothetical protein
LLSAALAPMCLGGCQSMSNTDKGLLTGGALGATAGGLIGAVTRHPVAGAAIGAGLGAAAGGLTGAAIDNSERKAEARAAAAAAAAAPPVPPLSLKDVVDLTASGASDTVIVNQIRVTGSIYYLSAQDILYLQNSGVREPVISEMQATAYRVPRRIYSPAPVVQPVYVYPPPPPPPPIGLGVGFTFRR